MNTVVDPKTGIRTARTAEQRRTKAIGTLYGMLVAYMAVEFIRPQFFIAAIGIFRPGMILGIAITFYWIREWGIGQITKDRLIRYFLFIVLFAIVWVPLATNNFWAFQMAQTLLVYLLAAVVPLSIVLTNPHRRYQFVDFWIAVHVYLAIFGMTHAGRGPGSFLSDENDLAMALCTSLPFAFLAAQRKGNTAIRSSAYIVASLIIVVGVMWTGSRGGFIGLAVVTIYMLWLSKHFIRNVIIIAILGVTALTFAPESYVGEIQSISDTEDSTRNDRIHKWRIAWVMFKDNPVFGVGPANYPWRVADYQNQLDDYTSGERVFGGRAAHSLYFTVLPEMGLYGTILMSLIGIGMFRRLRQYEKRLDPDGDEQSDLDRLFARSIRASLLGYLSAGAFISVLYYPYFWFAVGWVAALHTPQLANRVAASRVRHGAG